MECLSICINSRCIKKAQSLAEADPASLFKQLFTHTHTLTGISLVEIESAYAWQLTQKTLLPSSGWTSARAPGHLQKHCTPPADLAPEMDGRVCVNGRWSVCGRGGRSLSDEGSCTVSAEGGQRPPDNNSCPHSDGTNKKRAPSAAPASGPPSPPQGKVHHSP